MWKVLWRTQQGEWKIFYGVSYERAMEQRSWCNSVKFPVVAVLRSD